MNDLPSPRSRSGLWFELELARRFLRSGRRDAHIRVLTRVASWGLSIGVAALVLALAALSGFQDRLLSDLRARTPWMQVELTEEVPVEALEERLATVSGVGGVQLLQYGYGLLRAGNLRQPVEIVAFENGPPSWLPPPISERFPELGSEPSPEPGVWVQEGLLERGLLAVGDTVELISPRPTLGPRGPQPRSSFVTVQGFHDPGRSEESLAHRVGLPAELGRRLVGRSDRRLDLEPATDNGGGEGVQEVAKRVASALAGMGHGALKVRTWRRDHRALLFVLDLEKSVVFLAVVLIATVASFALVSSVALILTSKQHDLAVLLSLGALTFRLRRVFLWVGSLLSLRATAIGGLVGCGAAWFLESTRLIRLPEDVYIVDHLPFLLRGVDVMAVVASATALTLLASYLGSRRAGRGAIIDVLRRAR